MENNYSLFWLLFYICAFSLFFLQMYWQLVASRSLIHYSGPIKRGTLVWREPLPKEIERFLRNLSTDVIDGRRFIKVANKAILIGGASAHFQKNSLPYVAYIDFTYHSPRIEYRTSLPALLFILPFLFLFPPIAIFIILWNHKRQTEAIMDLIHEQMQKNPPEIIPPRQSPSLPDESESLVTITPRGKQILSVTTIAFTLNFMLFWVTSIMLGGTAINGYIVNDHYYLTNHAVDTEVSQTIWILSYIYTVATCLTFPLQPLVALYLFLRREIKINWPS